MGRWYYILPPALQARCLDYWSQLSSTWKDLRNKASRHGQTTEQNPDAVRGQEVKCGSRQATGEVGEPGVRNRGVSLGWGVTAPKSEWGRGSSGQKDNLSETTPQTATAVQPTSGGN